MFGLKKHVLRNVYILYKRSVYRNKKSKLKFFKIQFLCIIEFNNELLQTNKLLTTTKAFFFSFH